MTTRGIRGATTATENSAAAILAATRELLERIQVRNPELDNADIGSIFFTVGDDLNAAYPAKAARELGWLEVPLLCAQEIPVPGGPKFVIRVLLHWNTDLAQRDVQHVYLHNAAALRPDIPQAVVGD